MNLIEDLDTNLIEGKYNDLINGVYEKTKNVKTCDGKTMTAEISLEQTMEIVKRRIEAKTRIPMDDQHLVARGKVLKDNIPLKEYGISGGDTIELTAQLLGGVKHKSLSPKPMDTERDKKRKESEPYIDVGGLEGEKPQEDPDEVVATKKWMSEAMRELKERSDDMSELEQSITKVQSDMNDDTENLNKVAEALTKVSDDNNVRDRKFDDFIKNLNTGLHERDKKTDEKIERMERQIDAKIEEKFAGLDTRISAIERGTTEARCRRLDNAQGKYLRLWNLTKDSTGKDWAASSTLSAKRKESNCIGYN